jgi:putative thiamine transport system ATP-binding protein
LAFIAGFLDPDFRASGTLRLHGKVLNRLPAEQRRVGLLFQDAMLFPHLSVGDNLRFGLPQKTGDSQRQRDDKIEAALEALGLQDFASRDPATLSGGQQSRVALMRLLLSEPQAILLDEPFSKLDTSLKDEIRAFTFDSIRTAQIPALLVTHDKGDAESARGPLITL